MELLTGTLGDICDEAGGVIRTGPFGSQLHESDYKESGVPVIMPKNIVDGKISTEEIAHIGESDANRLYHHRLGKGDIVYGRRGDIGRRALITNRESGWLCGTGCIRISLGNSVLDPSFLYYYLGQPDVISWIYNQAIGATLPNLNTSIIRSIPIRYPPLLTQRKIAAILSAYDDLIENNTRRIKILEEMAQALYREWFVEFRFPGHETVRMVDSPLGEIPEGWEVKRLEDMYYTTSGGTPSRKNDEYYYSGSINWIKTRELNDSFIFETEEKITDLGLEKSSAKLLPENTVVMAMYGATIGKLGILASPSTTNQACCAFITRIDTFGYSYVFLHLLANKKKIVSLGMGAAQQNLSQQVIKQFKMLKPPIDLMLNFNSIADPIFESIKVLQAKIINLRYTRDLLQPRLISGDLDISKLEITERRCET